MLSQQGYALYYSEPSFAVGALPACIPRDGLPYSEGCVICCSDHMQVLTSELFGLQHFASNHALMHLAPTIGGLLFSATLAGNLYSIKGRAHNDPPGSCFGGDCYR